MSDTIDSRLKAAAGNGLEYDAKEATINVLKADNTTFGGVKLKRVVDNDDTDEWDVTSDGVYAYTPGYKTRPTDVQSLVSPSNGILTVYAYASNGFFICLLDTRKPISAGDDVLTIEGYDTPIDSTVMYLTNPDSGSKPVTTAIVIGGGPITITSQNDISADNAYIAIPVYKI